LALGELFLKLRATHPKFLKYFLGENRSGKAGARATKPVFAPTPGGVARDNRGRPNERIVD
jgi:hypothetical protein